jgi:tRNA modification GTPase
VRRARSEIARADLVLYVIDSAAPPAPAELAAELAALPEKVPVLRIWNKVDLLPEGSDPSSISVSATTGTGLDALRERIKAQAGYEHAGGGAWSARARHLDALRRARENMTRAMAGLDSLSAFELVAEELRLAQRALGEITGEVTSDELLGRIFSSFCIGK